MMAMQGCTRSRCIRPAPGDYPGRCDRRSESRTWRRCAASARTCTARKPQGLLPLPPSSSAAQDLSPYVTDRSTVVPTRSSQPQEPRAPGRTSAKPGGLALSISITCEPTRAPDTRHHRHPPRPKSPRRRPAESSRAFGRHCDSSGRGRGTAESDSPDSQRGAIASRRNESSASRPSWLPSSSRTASPAVC